MATVTRQGRQNINQQLEEKVARPIQFDWKGNLEESQQELKSDINVYNDRNIIQVGSKNEILKFLEFGTSPHEITPKNADFLVFEWPDAPQEIKEMFSATFPTVFFKKVNHPGIKAYGHMRKAVSRSGNR